MCCIDNHSSLGEIFSPYELVFGKKCNLPIEFNNQHIEPIYDFEKYSKEAKFKLHNAHLKAIQLLDKAKLQNKKYYDRNKIEFDYFINDTVLLKIEPYNKLKQVYSGPFKVISCNNPNVTILIDEITNKTDTVHKDRLRLVQRALE